MMNLCLIAGAALAAGPARDRRTIADLKNSVDDFRARVVQIQEDLAATDTAGADAVATLSASVSQVAPSISRIDRLVQSVAQTEGNINGITAKADAELDGQKNRIAASIAQIQQQMTAYVAEQAEEGHAEVDAALEELESSTGALVQGHVDTFERLEAPANAVVDRLKTSHHVDKKTPIYHWNFWHQYLNCCVGWYDGNNPRAFGGVHPSQWGDGNANADWIHPEMKYVKRLFSKVGYGDKDHGATVCAETRMVVHSTDDMRCGVAFRIKNTNGGNTNWRVNWSFTGRTGWGGRASVAVNKRNVWHGGCHGWCNRNDNINIEANSKRNRISTVIFVAGAAHPYGHYNHMRTTALAFNSLNLPNGLEYIDDWGTVPGNHRWDRDN